jgi:hypothetical protein
VLTTIERANAGFFNLIRTHTIQGTFSDPFYGGNANFVGWDLIGYPGARTTCRCELAAARQETRAQSQVLPTITECFPRRSTSRWRPHSKRRTS